MIRYKKVFTLAKPSVIIITIVIVAMIIVAGLSQSRENHRDAGRLTDIKSIQTALELYFDVCGGYPNNTAGEIKNGTDNTSSGLSGGENNPLCPEGTTFNTFMDVIPANQINGGESYTYCGTPNELPEKAVNPLSNAECGEGGFSMSYLIGFNLEGSEETLDDGDHNASPAGFR